MALSFILCLDRRGGYLINQFNHQLSQIKGQYKNDNPVITQFITYRGKQINYPKSVLTLKGVKPPRFDVGCADGILTIYEDDMVIITIANPNETTLTPAEFESEGHDKRVIIVDKVSGAITFIENVEAAKNFHLKLNSFLHGNDLTIQDFLGYAKNNIIDELFDTFIEIVGWKISRFP